MMDNPEIRKELLGRDSAWIAERIAMADAINTELLEALEHAVNWTKGYGFPEEHKPVWIPQAEEAIRKASR